MSAASEEMDRSDDRYKCVECDKFGVISRRGLDPHEKNTEAEK